MFSRILKLAIPSALGFLAQYAMQVEDTFFVGRLGAQAMGGVSLGHSLFGLCLVAGFGLLMGLDFLIARAHGAGNIEERNRCFYTGLMVAVVLGVVFALPVMFAPRLLLAVGVEAALIDQACLWLFPVTLSLVPAIVFQAIRSFLQAQEIATPALVILIFGNVLNVIGNFLWVWNGPKSIEGSGLATLWARWAMVLVAAGYVFYRRKQFQLSSPWVPLRNPLERAKMMLRLGGPACLQTVFEVGVFSAATWMAGRLGEKALAAHHVAIQMAGITFMLPLGISASASALVGQSMGARVYSEARSLGDAHLKLGVGVMALTACGFAVFGGELASLFTTDLEVKGLIRSLLWIAAGFQIFDGIQVVSTGALRGVGNTTHSAVANFAGHWCVGLPMGMALSEYSSLGVHGLWMGLSTGLLSVAAYVWWKWRRFPLPIADFKK